MRRFLLVLLAIPLLSGCGGVDASLLATAVHKTEVAGGAEIAFQWNYEVPGRDTPVVMRVTAELPGGGEIEAVGDRDVLYMRSELLGDELGGKEWMKLDLARTYDSLGIDLGALGQVGQGSSEQLEATGEASGDVSDEGRQVVRGVETNHYSTMIGLTKAGGTSRS